MIQSTRLKILPFTLDDLEASCLWFQDPEVMRWIPGGADPSMDATRARIEKYIVHYETHGFSKYILRDAKTDEALGDCGIMHLDGTDLIELGYRIRKEFWQKGYATEAAGAVILHAFETLKLHQLHAIIEQENLISKRILEEKLSFRYVRMDIFLGQKMGLYVLDNNL